MLTRMTQEHGGQVMVAIGTAMIGWVRHRLHASNADETLPAEGAKLAHFCSLCGPALLDEDDAGRVRLRRSGSQIWNETVI